MPIIYVGIGFILLISGRPVYWLFVGSMGYLVGEYLVGRTTLLPMGWDNWMFPIILALVGVSAAFFLRRWAARVAGFIAGGYLLYYLPMALGAESKYASHLLFAIAGAVAFVLLLFLFDAGLVFLSSLTAVTMILSSFKVGRLDQGLMFIILVIFGLIVQYLLLQYSKPSPD